ncbi:helix-turn-helix domain-containing protein [Nocardia sp.]|uniref:helix-turn-helix domain-containing protein n=1 Tax=Nocardia sp. TaxID=1821 RepID=UPI0026068C02|nr:helix-turn-helix domain-containing protein [Nocardia sp.]
MFPINTATAATVRDAIAQAERTEVSVAKGAHITPSTWQRRIHGRTSFTVNDLSRISADLGVKIGDLVDTIADKLR